MDREDKSCFVRHAYVEQTSLKLKWYTSINAMQSMLQKRSGRSGALTPLQYRHEMRSVFVEHWEAERHDNKKLGFYNSIKPCFAEEPYLSSGITHQESKRLTQLRTSSHGYSVERGRYAMNRANPLSKICRHCSTTDEEALLTLTELPLFEPIVEDELHVLRTCPLYHDLRSNLCDNIKNGIFSNVGDIFSENLVKDTSRFILRAFKRRFPKAK